MSEMLSAVKAAFLSGEIDTGRRSRVKNVCHVRGHSCARGIAGVSVSRLSYTIELLKACPKLRRDEDRCDLATLLVQKRR